MESKQSISRRGFLKTTALAGAGVLTAAMLETLPGGLSQAWAADPIAPGSTIGANGGIINAGGTYSLDTTSGGTVTVNTTAPVVLKGQGADADETMDLNVVGGVAGVNITISGVNLYNTSKSAFEFQGKGNVLAIEDENTMYVFSNRVMNTMIYVPNDAELTFAGNGTLNFTGYSRNSVGIGGDSSTGRTPLNGTINFGTDADAPTLNFDSQRSGIGSSPSYTGTDGTPGVITFVNGMYNLLRAGATTPMVGGIRTYSAADGKNAAAQAFKIVIGSEATVNVIEQASWGSGTAFLAPVLGAGNLPSSTSSWAASYDPSLGGTLTVEDGGILRCFVNEGRGCSTWPTNYPYSPGYNGNIIGMTIKDLYGAELESSYFDLAAAGISGSFSYMVGNIFGEYDPETRGYAGPASWSATLSSTAANELPVYAEEGVTTISINDVDYEL